MYNSYCEFLTSITNKDIKNIPFKNHPNYNNILEHVDYDTGVKYLELIEQEHNLDINHIINFCSINDSIGFPNKFVFLSKDNKVINCSPTSLRYVYQAIKILKHYNDTQNSSIVEVGCGYGGLFLAISYFSSYINNIHIKHYFLVDLPIVCDLINLYLDCFKDKINISYSTHSSYVYGSDIYSNDLFFISNYCFTEIDEEHRIKYTNNLIHKCNHGFVIWQTYFHPINLVNLYIKQNYSFIKETPQTSPHINGENYYILF